MSDYLKDSRFGQVATSLLGQGRKAKRREILYSLLGGLLKGQQRRLKQRLTDTYNNLQTEYSNVFENYQAKYDKNEQNRIDLASFDS